MTATLDGSGGEVVVTPIDTYLAEQADMSSVERFARREVVGRTGQWTDLIPLTNPSKGEQFRFDVDLDLCTGCKACVTACHSLNGLDESESFRSVGLLVGSDVLPEINVAESTVDLASLRKVSDAEPEPVVNQPVTTACHHCVDPGCLNGCPAEAYEKDPTTGIVSHLDDACIGCKYCTMTCPYDVPVYNKRLGIVRKCDMCAGRLAEGEAPACVQGCPNEAISISIVDTTALADQLEAVGTETKRLVPGAADSSLTTPTTFYRRQRPIPEAARPVDRNTISPGHAHTPLAALLVLSQLAVGLHLARLVGGETLSDGQRLASAVLVPLVAAISIAISVLHLGQPLKAWRAVLGFKHSWLSREVVALSGFFGLTLASAAAAAQDWASAVILDTGTGLAGVVAVGCSAMVYGVTGRRWWRPSLVITKFGLTTLQTGLAGLLCLLVMSGATLASAGGVVAAQVVSVVVTFLVERSVVDAEDDEQRRSAALLSGELSTQRKARAALGLVGGLVCPVLALILGSGGAAIVVAVIGLGCVVGSELLARVLFFTASSVPHMPGTMA